MRITDRIDGEDGAFRDVILGYDNPAEYERHAGKEGVFYDFRHGFCLEPQYYPNAVNEEWFASPLLHPGETYQAHTKIKFYQK